MKKIIFACIVIPILAVAMESIYYTKKVADLCDNSVEKKLSEVYESAKTKGLAVSSSSSSLMIHAAHNFGVGVCFLRIKNDFVVEARFDFD